VALVGVWDANTGREVATLEGHGGVAHSCEWSPDGRVWIVHATS